jgi:L-asparagine transporter-like permease
MENTHNLRPFDETSFISERQALIKLITITILLFVGLFLARQNQVESRADVSAPMLDSKVQPLFLPSM